MRSGFVPTSILLAACSAPAMPRGPVPVSDAQLRAAAQRIARAHANSAPLLTSDGRVIFSSDREGMAQLYVADMNAAGAPPRELLRWPDPIASAALAHDGSLIFSADRDGDELSSLFRTTLDGGAPIEIAPGERLLRDGAILPAQVPNRVFYSARKRNETAWAIHAADLDGTASATVYRDDHNGWLMDVRADGRVALIQHFRAWADRRLIGVDLESGARTLLYPRQGEASLEAAAFTPDGRVLLATDGGAEQSLVLALDARDGRELARYSVREPSTARVADLRLSPDGRRLAIALDAGNRTELELLDGERLERRCRIAMPLGTGSIGEFSPDGTRLGVTWSTIESPPDLWVVDPVSCSVSPLRSERRDDVADPVTSEVVAIPSFDGTRLPTNVHVPAHPAGTRLPVIMRLHGGPAGAATMGWEPLARFLLARGYAWVAPNVRGSGGFGRAFEQADNGGKRVDAFRDIDSVATWIAAQPWADPDRMIVLGESYGGYAVLMSLVLHPSRWRAGIDLFGLADLETFMGSTTGRVRDNYRVELGDPEVDAAFLRSISPLTHVDRIVDPLFVYAGANDPRVPKAQSDLIVGALRRRGIPVEYMLSPHEGHGMQRRDTVVEACVRIVRFLERVASDPPTRTTTTR